MSQFPFLIYLLLVVFPFLIGQCFFRVRTLTLYVPSLLQKDPGNGGACGYHEI